MSPGQPGDPFDDPFAENPRTFVMPTPGARTAAPVAPAPGMAPGADVSADLDARDTGLNPLVALANPLLAVVPQIRATASLPDPAALKETLAQCLREFDAKAPQQGISPERVMAARYILCTLLDEVAAATPWGGSGAWSRYSLLAMFHNETSGGEKVFQLMAKLAENPTANRDLLELIYGALCLGFQGRYRVIEGGSAQLEAVRDRLAQILKKERGDYPLPLAEHWRGQTAQRRPLLSWLPLWVSATVAGALLLGLFWGLSTALGNISDPTFGQIQSLRLLPPTPTVVQAAPKPRLAQFLAADIRGGQVAVRDDLDRSVVTIRGDGLFEPASATLTDSREALMQRIAAALAKVAGPILVTGHTDDQPINTVRFPSNWHLSEERAKAVRTILLANGVPAARVTAEGHAAGEPLVANDTAANRSMNRRVEVILMAAKSGAGS